MSATSFKDRLLHDAQSGAWFDQTRRYMMIRPDALMGIFRRLPEPARMEALEAFAHSIAQQGGDSARAYVEMGGTGDKLLDVIACTAPELGWGIWAFERGQDSIRLSVRNSPFAAGYGVATHPVCMPIVGMIGAVSTLVMGQPMQAREIQCAAMGHETCLFEAISAGAQHGG